MNPFPASPNPTHYILSLPTLSLGYLRRAEWHLSLGFFFLQFILKSEKWNEYSCLGLSSFEDKSLQILYLMQMMLANRISSSQHCKVRALVGVNLHMPKRSSD